MPTTSAATITREPHGASRRATFITLNDEDGLALTDGVNSDSDSDSDEESLVQVQMKGVIKNIRKFEQDLKKTRRENRELQRRLDAYKEGALTTPRKRASVNIETTIKIQELEGRVEELEGKNTHLRKKIKCFKEKEIRAEAEDLVNGDMNDEIGDRDGFYKMRKILRKFCDWMSITTIGMNEFCFRCGQALAPKKCYALPCHHVLCVECLPKASRGADETVRCDRCEQYCVSRTFHPREDLELLGYTENERWDELLKLASKFSYVDYGGKDTSEEEAEEDFINDCETETEVTNGDETEIQAGEGEEVPVIKEEDRREKEDFDIKKEEDEEKVQDVIFQRSTPETEGQKSYTDSPTKEKRKKMENLALLRSKRQRKI